MSANPYAPPVALTVPDAPPSGPTSSAEAERRLSFKAEGHVRAVGALAYLASVGMGFAALGQAVGAVLAARKGQDSVGLNLAATLLNATCCVLLFLAARGLRRIQPLGRTLYAIAVTLSLGGSSVIGALAGAPFDNSTIFRTLVAIGIAQSLWTKDRAPLFSDYYQAEVLAKTPQLVAPTARWVWWLFGIIGTALLAGIIVGIAYSSHGAPTLR